MAQYLWDKITGKRVKFLHSVDAREALASGKFLHEDPKPAVEKKEETKTVVVEEKKEIKEEKVVEKEETEKEEEKPKTSGPSRMGPKKVR